MPELITRLNRLLLRLDHMGMRAEQAFADALHALKDRDIRAADAIDRADDVIDREEVEIEQECVRLLALYQPAAIDLRTICTVIKVNNDLERIADHAASMARRVKRVVEHDVDLQSYPGYDLLVSVTGDLLSRTVRMISAVDANIAGSVIEGDSQIDQAYKALVRAVLEREGRRVGGTEAALTVINLAKAMERIADLCTNIAEDMIFLRTGDIVRHADAFDHDPSGPQN